MERKINPLGFKLGTTQGHYSLWFAQPQNYSECLQEDQKIHNCITNYVQKNIKKCYGVEGIARVEIQKIFDVIQIIIYMGFPKFLIEGKPKRIEELQMTVEKEFNCVNRKTNISIIKIAKPYGQPKFLHNL